MGNKQNNQEQDYPNSLSFIRMASLDQILLSILSITTVVCWRLGLAVAVLQFFSCTLRHCPLFIPLLSSHWEFKAKGIRCCLNRHADQFLIIFVSSFDFFCWPIIIYYFLFKPKSTVTEHVPNFDWEKTTVQPVLYFAIARQQQNSPRPIAILSKDCGSQTLPFTTGCFWRESIKMSHCTDTIFRFSAKV